MKRRSNLKLWLLALVCFGPVVAAYLLFYYGDLGELPLLENEERRLFRPAVPLPAVSGQNAAGDPVDNLWDGPLWSLVYVRTAPCAEDCLQSLTHLYQVDVALGRDQDRVQRVYVGPEAEPLQLKASVDAAGRVDSSGGAALLDLLESAEAAPGAEGAVYVVDPHGNLVLSYPPDPGQEGLRDDLERLLDVSQIG